MGSCKRNLNRKPSMSREFFVMKLLRSTFFAMAIGLFASLLILEDTNANEKQINLVVFGDSLVAGYGLAPGEAFPEKLQIALDKKNYNIAVTNAGVSGDTTSAGLARLDWSIAEGTDGVILELGANDALRGIPASVTKENLLKMIARLKERNIEIILAGMLAPPNMGQDYASEFNPIFPELAKLEDLTLYPFFLEGVAGQPELNQADAMHPTAKGIDVIIENIMPVLETFINKLKPA